MQGRVIRFELPLLLPTANVVIRMQHHVRARMRNTICAHVKVATQGQRPPTPFLRARVTVERIGKAEPDADGLGVSSKFLLDVLQPLSKRHPSGLGIIHEDNPKHLEFVARYERVAKGEEQRTRVLIEELA
ncbi:MAG: hypothetical protein NVS3B2_04580 [Ramlibacter sp.]